MNKLLITWCLILLGISCCAQTNSSEAKAAYMLAEESYGKGDYKTALDYLTQVKSSLGSANCKVLYLEIMVTRELYSKENNSSEKLLDLISQFEKSPDYASYNPEKA